MGYPVQASNPCCGDGGSTLEAAASLRPTCEASDHDQRPAYSVLPVTQPSSIVSSGGAAISTPTAAAPAAHLDCDGKQQQIASYGKQIGKCLKDILIGLCCAVLRAQRT